MECFVYNWRILLGGAASAAILAVGVAAPAFAQAQDAPVSLSGLNSASGVLCGVSLPVSGSIPALGNTANAAPGVANTAGTLGGSSSTTTTTNSATPGFSEEPGGSSTTNNTGSGSSSGLGSVTGTLSGVTGSLQNGSLNGGAISTPLSGQNG